MPLTNTKSIQDLHVNFWSHLDVEVHYSHSSTLLFTEINHPYFNGILRANLPRQNTQTHMDTTIAQFKLRKLPFTWMTVPETSSIDYPKWLLPKGFMCLGQYPCMVLDFPMIEKERPLNGLTIEPVLQAETLNEWGKILKNGFEWPDQVVAAFRNLLLQRGLDEPPIHHYIGRIRGTAVGAATLFIEGEVVGIFNLTVLPEWRRKGIATGMIHSILEYLRSSKCRIIVAQASPDSYLFFQNQGFYTHTNFEIFCSY